MLVKKIISVYFSGFLVGVALVLFPAAGNIFVNPDYHGLTSGQFGSIFIPQIVLAIIASLSAPKLAEKIGMKKVMLYGLGMLFLSMVFLAGSNWLMKGPLDYWLIMLATACIGAGFGFTITDLNPFAYSLFPGKETSAVTAMHILLGLGTASSALLLNLFYNNGVWWAAPTLVAGLIVVLFFFALATPLELPIQKEEQENETKKGVPLRIWLFALGVFLYGACEATFGNFGSVFLEKEGGLSLAKASLGLSLFWGGITIGRVLFTLFALKFNTKTLYMIAPFVLSLVFFLIPMATSEFALLGCMFLGGLSSSFLFPKSISTPTDEFPKHAAIISGAMVAAIQLGTGFSSNVIGFFNSYYSLATLFQFSALYALGLGILITTLILKQK